MNVIIATIVLIMCLSSFAFAGDYNEDKDLFDTFYKQLERSREIDKLEAEIKQLEGHINDVEQQLRHKQWLDRYGYK